MTSSAPADGWELVPIGEPGPGTGVIARGMNDNGDVVGTMGTAEASQAFLWADGKLVPLGTLGGSGAVAWAVNNARVVVGESLPEGASGSTNYRAFRWSAGEMEPLPTLGGSWSVAYDVNDNGVIAGLSANTVQHEKAVRWVDGAIDNISLNSNHQRSRSLGINASGVIVGFAYTPLAGPNDAFSFDDGEWTVIDGFGPFENAEAYAVNDAGVAVGVSSFPTIAFNGTIWAPGEEKVGIGVLAGHEDSTLHAINNAGLAVGRSFRVSPPQESRAVLWDGERLVDLNEHAPAEFSGLLVEATDINDSGRIAVVALVGGNTRSYLMIPPTVLSGDLDGNGAVDGADLGLLLAAWGTKGPGDLDGNGTVDGADLGVLLSAWTG